MSAKSEWAAQHNRCQGYARMATVNLRQMATNRTLTLVTRAKAVAILALMSELSDMAKERVDLEEWKDQE